MGNSEHQLMAEKWYLLILFVLGSTKELNAQWIHYKTTHDQTKIFYAVPDSLSSRIFKIETVVKCSSESAFKLIRSAEKGSKWINRVSNFEEIEKISDSVWVTHSEIDLPWPLNNKDLVTKNSLTGSIKSEFFIHSISSPEFIPHKKNFKRIIHFSGLWGVKPIENESILLTYKVHSSDNELLPQWLVTPFIVNGLWDTILALKKMLEIKP